MVGNMRDGSVPFVFDDFNLGQITVSGGGRSHMSDVEDQGLKDRIRIAKRLISFVGSKSFCSICNEINLDFGIIEVNNT